VIRFQHRLRHPKVKDVKKTNPMGARLSMTKCPAELSRLDRIVLHLRCLWRDHKYRWHLAGVWREVTLH